MDEVMTLDEVAAYLRIHVDTVRRWAREGTLPAVKLGKAYRVNSGDLQSWWKERLARQGTTVGDATRVVEGGDGRR